MSSYDNTVEVETYDDEDDLQLCLKRFDDTIDSFNVEQHYFASSIVSSATTDPVSCMNAVRKLYLDKCNENIGLKQEI